MLLINYHRMFSEDVTASINVFTYDRIRKIEWLWVKNFIYYSFRINCIFAMYFNVCSLIMSEIVHLCVNFRDLILLLTWMFSCKGDVTLLFCQWSHISFALIYQWGVTESFHHTQSSNQVLWYCQVPLCWLTHWGRVMHIYISLN